MSRSQPKNETLPPAGGRPPRESLQPPTPGLYERPAQSANIPAAIPSAAPTLGGKPEISDKPEAPGQSESTPQSDLGDQQIRIVQYELPGSRVQSVSLSPGDPDYEQPMDMSIPAHWVVWERTHYHPPGDFARAIEAIMKEWNVLRLLIKPPVGGGVSAVQALHPRTRELGEPYLEVRVFEDDTDTWPTILPVIQNLVVKHMPKKFHHMRIRFSFPNGRAFSATHSTPKAVRAALPTTYTPSFRQKHKHAADKSLVTPEPIRETYGDGQHPLTTAERAQSVVWREDKECNIGNTTAVGGSIGVKDGRLIDPKFGTGTCGPKFKLKNLKTGEFEKYDDGTDAFFVTTAHHVLHRKNSRDSAYPDQMYIYKDGKQVITHPTRRDWEATIFSRQDRDASYAEALQDRSLEPATKKKIEKVKGDDLLHHKDNDPRATVIGEMFLTTGQSAVVYTAQQIGPLLDARGPPYLNDLSLVKLSKDVADHFDNVLPNNKPIPRAFAADFDLVLVNPSITGMQDFNPKDEELLIKVGRSTGLSVGKVSPERQLHNISKDKGMHETSNYCIRSVQAGTAIGYYGDSGAGLYNKSMKLVGFLSAGHDDTVETPIYLIPIQLVQAELRKMEYELHICPAGTKVEPAPATASAAKGNQKTKKTIGKKEGRQVLEREAKKQVEDEKQRKADELAIMQKAAPDATGCNVLEVAINGAEPERKYLVRLVDGQEKWFPRSMLGRSWQPAITAFCSQTKIGDDRQEVREGDQAGRKVVLIRRGPKSMAEISEIVMIEESFKESCTVMARPHRSME